MDFKIYTNPTEADVADIVRRPTKDATDLTATVAAVLADVRERGDAAVLDYEQRFDQVALASLAVSDDEFAAAEAAVSAELRQALEQAYINISRFHEAQRPVPVTVETAAGVRCWQKGVPIERVGLYVPGGTAPLFSTVLMLAAPARIAGCSEVVLCTPPQRDGSVHPAILVAARIAGVGRVFKCGGVQAIGAMAYGTASVPKVCKIFGPGNQYVQAAKQQVALTDVAIDMPAGPSEVAVIADETAQAAFVASDLLAQAEHGRDSQVLLLTTSRQLLDGVVDELERQLEALPRRDIAAAALANSRLVLVASLAEAMRISNIYAPEHLIIETADAPQLAQDVVNAGSVFIGHLTPESAGDYASGTNHTLPTNGWAKAYSGVNLDAYYRKITFQQLSPEGVRSIAATVEAMAAAESLEGHRNAMTLRRLEVEGPTPGPSPREGRVES